MSERVLVGMSGGVDSAVAALLLMRAGYEVIGVTFLLWTGEGSGVEESVRDAASICARLGIEHTVLDLAEDFHREVIDAFIASYESGETPNPCVTCNRRIKFSKLLEKADEMRAKYVATGHYARVEKVECGEYLLKKAVDEGKDQSYFLYALGQAELSRVLFPLGDYTKAEIRAIAEENGFVNARKRDSQDICFVTDGDYAAFIEKYMGKSFPIGDFVDGEGKVLGKHKGAIRYTVGQRKGLGVALGRPMFVCAKDMVKNTVTLGENEDLFSHTLTARDARFVTEMKIGQPVPVAAKIRNTQKETAALLTRIDEVHFRVDFDVPQRAIARGQSVVLYAGDTVLGGGIIE
ncbi:MAG: tRNA 2-thiouridine(34) synthase MnmA [Ruminococcaceae bacterium]|nr:tRNA 2-thiouridine(34) synthase MnmA [Oscillospiraceae bacterium]